VVDAKTDTFAHSAAGAVAGDGIADLFGCGKAEFQFTTGRTAPHKCHQMRTAGLSAAIYTLKIAVFCKTVCPIQLNTRPLFVELGKKLPGREKTVNPTQHKAADARPFIQLKQSTACDRGDGGVPVRCGLPWTAFSYGNREPCCADAFWADKYEAFSLSSFQMGFLYHAGETESPNGDNLINYMKISRSCQTF